MTNQLILTRIAFHAIIAVAVAACGAGTDPAETTCGDPPSGITCRTAKGECAALTCIESQWRCGTDQTVVALVPANCSQITPDSDGGQPDGDCGPMPMGVTCRKPSGECAAQACVAGTWQCAAGETAVDLRPENCTGSGAATE